MAICPEEDNKLARHKPRTKKRIPEHQVGDIYYIATRPVKVFNKDIYIDVDEKVEIQKVLKDEQYIVSDINGNNGKTRKSNLRKKPKHR